MIVYLIMISAIFSLVFYFENIDISSVLYGFLISFFAIIIAFIYDFRKFLKQYKILSSLISNFPYINDFEDISSNEIEKLYTDLILKLTEYSNEIIYNKESEEKEIIDFYTMWIHQIKTPIFALNLLIKKYPENSELISELSKIESYSNMALNYVKLSSENTEILIENVNIKELVNEVIKEFSGIFISKKIKLIINVEDLFLKIDRKWFKFALSQIISNATKYVKNGEVSILLQRNKLIIKDNGIGISSEDLPKVFDKGFTGYTGRINQNSTGLGLYLCKKSLDLLGLNISIKSELSVGTKVYIDLIQSESFFE